MKPLVRAWTEDELARLRAMSAAGASATRCAAAFNRPINSVRKQAQKLGVPIAGVREANAANKAKIAAAESKLSQGSWRNDGSRI